MKLCKLEETIEDETDFLGFAEHSENGEQFRVYGNLLNPEDEKIQTGFYKHKRGKFYEVLGTAKDPKTKEDLVVYKGLFEHEKRGKEAIWVRPLEMFKFKDKEGNPRFKFLESA